MILKRRNYCTFWALLNETQSGAKTNQKEVVWKQWLIRDLLAESSDGVLSIFLKERSSMA